MNKNKKKLPKQSETTSKEILRIDWEDHFSGNSQWGHFTDMDHKPHIVCTVGIKVHEDKKVITLAQNVVSDVRGADTTTIIKSCIVSKMKLGEVKFAKQTKTT